MLANCIPDATNFDLKGSGMIPVSTNLGNSEHRESLMEAGAHLRRCHNVDSDTILPHCSPKTLHERSNGGFRCGILECFWPIDEARHTSLEDQATIAITISILKTPKVVSREFGCVKQSLEVDIYCRKCRLLRILIWVFLYVSMVEMKREGKHTNLLLPSLHLLHRRGPHWQ